MSFCQQCGNRVEASSTFCSSCGANLSEKTLAICEEIAKAPVTFRIITEGKCLTGFDSNKVRGDFARLMRQSEAIAANLLAGSETTIKTGIDKVAGDHYLSTLRQIGVECRMEEETIFLDVDIPLSAQPATGLKIGTVATNQAAPEPSIAPDENWYYEIAERQFGPLSTSKMVDFINKRIISASTLIKPESGDWTTAINSKLSAHLERLALAGPSKDINNTFVWLLAATPIVGAIIEIILGVGTNNQFMVFVGYFIAYSILCTLDIKSLNSDGHQGPNIAWLLLVPVYLWQRASLLKQAPQYFWVWIVAFILSVFVTVYGN